MEALDGRHSSRDFADEALSPQQLSNLLWAACGINRPESGKRTMPSSYNKQEIDVYVAMKDGLFFYNFKNHTLIEIFDEDIRKQTGTQDFVEMAAVNLVYVADYSKIEGEPENRKFTTGIDVGVIVQNVYLYCSSEGLGTVARAGFDKDILTKLMQLKENQEIILTQSVGPVEEL